MWPNKQAEEGEDKSVQSTVLTLEEIEEAIQSKSPKFKKILASMYSLHLKKNSDYTGGSPDVLKNFRLSEEFNVPVFEGVMVRLSDKVSRICGLVKKGKADVKDESIEDTLLDLANYAILALMAKQEGKKDDSH